jgi:hypothetical protein
MPTIGSRSGFSAFEPRRQRYPRQHGLRISAQRSAGVTPMSWSSASDIRASSPRSRSRLRHNCNAPRQRAKFGDVGPTAICGNAIRSMSFSWAIGAHKANPGGSGFAKLASRAGSAFQFLDKIRDASPSNDLSESIACGSGMRLQALGRAILGFALDRGRSLKEKRAGSHEVMTCEIFPFDCLRWISFGASSLSGGA